MNVKPAEINHLGWYVGFKSMATRRSRAARWPHDPRGCGVARRTAQAKCGGNMARRGALRVSERRKRGARFEGPGAAVPLGYGRGNFPRPSGRKGTVPPLDYRPAVSLPMAAAPDTKKTQARGALHMASLHNCLTAGQEWLDGIFAVLVRPNYPSMRRDFAH
jgi:hypothetical protein